MTETFERTIDRYLRRWRPTLRPDTLSSKHSALRTFTTFLREHHPDLTGFSQLQRQPHIEDWLEHLLYLKACSRNTRVRHLRLFFEDLIRWQWSEAPVPGLLGEEDIAPEETYLPRPLPPDIDQAVQDAFTRAGTFGAMALLLLRLTGMRIGEMRALELNAMEASGSGTFSLRVPLGKTRSERIIPLDARTAELVERIIEQRGCRVKRPIHEPLRHLMMLNHFGRHITQPGYRHMLGELTAHIDTTERIYCHRLRHTFATQMARAGMPVPALMKLLGHTTPKMTMRYVEVAQTDLREAYDQALTQLQVIRSVQARTLPMLSGPSPALPQPVTPQIPRLMEAILSALETQRRDATDPDRIQQLQRFIKRMRKAGYDLNEIL